MVFCNLYEGYDLLLCRYRREPIYSVAILQRMDKEVHYGIGFGTGNQ